MIAVVGVGTEGERLVKGISQREGCGGIGTLLVEYTCLCY